MCFFLPDNSRHFESNNFAAHLAPRCPQRTGQYSRRRQDARQITETYFNDPGIDQMNRLSSPSPLIKSARTAIVRLRKQAQEQGLDPKKWFGNVEPMVAKDIGQGTVQYVSNMKQHL
jgi:hypothetical protein